MIEYMKPVPEHAGDIINRAAEDIVRYFKNECSDEPYLERLIQELNKYWDIRKLWVEHKEN